MDIATLLGFIGAIVVVIVAMLLGGSLMVFVNIPSIMIVAVGSMLVVLMKFTLGQYIGSIKVALKAFFTKSDDVAILIKRSVELSNTARANGLLALENEEINSSFLKRGIAMLVDGLDASAIRSLMNKDMEQTIERHQTGQAVFMAYGDVAPAMGMIGTLIGLVQMLSNMSDPKTIGPAMAVALLTTLYGAMIANMIAIPIADKLKIRTKEERISKALIIDAVMAIQSGQNPRVVEEMLQNYLPGSKRVSAE